MRNNMQERDHVIDDPLSPSSRQTLLHSISTLSPSVSSEFAEPPTSSISTKSCTLASQPLSPHRALLNILNTVDPKLESQEHYPTRHSASHSTAKANALGTLHEVSRCGGEILYHAPIHIRFNNFQCLRMIRNESDSKLAQVDINGNGFGENTSQIFSFVHPETRREITPVHYSDVVAIYCGDGPLKGYYLSADSVSQKVSAKRIALITNAEKWKLQSSDSKESHEIVSKQPQELYSIDDVALNWGHGEIVETSNRVMLKMLTSDLFLSVTETCLVTLHRENDGIDDTRQVWEVTKAKIPYEPSWNREREYLTAKALMKSPKHQNDTKNQTLSTFPPSIQETLIIDDLLYIFIGIEGQYLKLEEIPETDTTLKFTLNQEDVDPSIATLALRCVCMGEMYLKLHFFVEKFSRYEYGQVHHAFSAALKILLKEYIIAIAQLEHYVKFSDKAFSLQNLWYQIQPSIQTLEILCKVADACAISSGGGALLTEIQRVKASLSGDARTNQMFSFLMEKASKPYLTMVERWICYGEIKDPYGDFMVRRDDRIKKDELLSNPYSTYWQARYTLRETQIPLFLSRCAQKILMAGKYLHVLRSCRRLDAIPFQCPIPYFSSDRKYDELVEQAHHFASKTLLDFYLKENDLCQRFRSLKHYFMMDQGDFFMDFMDVAEEELNSRAKEISMTRLESLLQLSLQTSTCSSDTYKDDLLCFLSPHNLIAQLEAIHERSQKRPRESLTVFSSSSIPLLGYKVIDAFTLNYKVQWPNSLIISCSALQKYQMIFRHLFFCKHVERRLCDAWMNHQSTKELGLRSALGPSLCLRQKMLHFQQNFVYYMMVEVVSQRFHSFEKDLLQVKSVDDIMQFHEEYLDSCLKECLLTDPDLLRVLTKLMTVCMTFANSIERFTRPYFLDEETIKAEREAERDRRAEKKAREEAEALVATYRLTLKNSTIGTSKRAVKLRRRESSTVDMRRARIKELASDVKRALTEKDGDTENPFVRMTSDLGHQFDTLLAEFMQQLLRRSLIQVRSNSPSVTLL